MTLDEFFAGQADITCRTYDRSADFKQVSGFLAANHRPGNKDGNWLQLAWEYLHSHPSLDETALGRIGRWPPEAGDAAAVVEGLNDYNVARLAIRRETTTWAAH